MGLLNKGVSLSRDENLHTFSPRGRGLRFLLSIKRFSTTLLLLAVLFNIVRYSLLLVTLENDDESLYLIVYMCLTVFFNYIFVYRGDCSAPWNFTENLVGLYCITSPVF